MRNLSQRTEEARGEHGVALWALPRKDYEITVIPDDGEAFVEVFNTVSYAHARGLALHKYGLGHRVPLDEEKQGS